jgi:hypothetical protein
MSLMAIKVTFTEVWTTHSKQFFINPYWTVTQFLESIKPLIKNEFYTNDFEIVETGQIIKGIASEEAPAITNSEIKIRNKWGYNLDISFYVRRKNYDYSKLRQLSMNITIDALKDINTPINPMIINFPIVDDCIICFENMQFINNINNFGCIHNICNNCYVNYRILNYNNCPICRRPFHN